MADKNKPKTKKGEIDISQMSTQQKKAYALTLAPFFKTKQELCAYIGISTVAYYDWLKRDTYYKKQMLKIIGTNVGDEAGRAKAILELGVQPYRIVKTTITDAENTNNQIKISSKVNDMKEMSETEGYVHYDNFKKDGFQQVEDMTAEQLTAQMKKRKKVQTKRVSVEIPVDVIEANKEQIHRQNSTEYTYAERIIKARAICELYGQGVQLSEALKAMKVPFDIFYNWIQPYSRTYTEEIKTMFDTAKTLASEIMKEDLVIVARNTIMQLLKPKKVINTVKTGKVTKDGKVIPLTVSQFEREIQPNTTILRDIMKNLMSEFMEGSQGVSPEDDLTDYFSSLTNEQIDEELERLEQRNKEAMQK